MVPTHRLEGELKASDVSSGTPMVAPEYRQRRLETKDLDAPWCCIIWEFTAYHHARASGVSTRKVAGGFFRGDMMELWRRLPDAKLSQGRGGVRRLMTMLIAHNLTGSTKTPNMSSTCPLLS
ncbi:hypothetical protein PI124_g3713 [Phytophthora idaei]|nr:hypothetical protein PI126_g1834 [Phytophthora idaei]KAG3251679.1 hypothetical protein PI124_g3713 [Phytophthora idaei]